MAFDIEDNATVASTPVHCPRCGAEVKMDGILGFLSRLLGLARTSSAMILMFNWKWRKPSCWLMNLPYVADPFLNYPDPRAEILQ